ncbi:hypothetical protein GCM10010394_12740 [Streptomyces crystallinus]|uniref:Uncharacterized protein n=1 Tax=Streptomyces crystallinus TaxID=68191 RepID=A0ABN1F8U1_9ACTN
MVGVVDDEHRGAPPRAPGELGAQQPVRLALVQAPADAEQRAEDPERDLAARLGGGRPDDFEAGGAEL